MLEIVDLFCLKSMFFSVNRAPSFSQDSMQHYQYEEVNAITRIYIKTSPDTYEYSSSFN